MAQLKDEFRHFLVRGVQPLATEDVLASLLGPLSLTVPFFNFFAIDLDGLSFAHHNTERGDK